MGRSPALEWRHWQWWTLWAVGGTSPGVWVWGKFWQYRQSGTVGGDTGGPVIPMGGNGSESRDVERAGGADYDRRSARW